MINNPLTKLEQLEQSARFTSCYCPDDGLPHLLECKQFNVRADLNNMLRNLAPELIALWKAAKDCEFYYGGDTHSGPIKRLKDALDALERKGDG